MEADFKQMHVDAARTRLLKAMTALDPGTADDPDDGERLALAATHAIVAALDLSRADSAVPGLIASAIGRVERDQ